MAEILLKVALNTINQTTLCFRANDTTIIFINPLGMHPHTSENKTFTKKTNRMLLGN
jgi:hypothetical protein